MEPTSPEELTPPPSTPAPGASTGDRNHGTTTAKHDSRARGVVREWCGRQRNGGGGSTERSATTFRRRAANRGVRGEVPVGALAPLGSSAQALWLRRGADRRGPPPSTPTHRTKSCQEHGYSSQVGGGWQLKDPNWALGGPRDDSMGAAVAKDLGKNDSAPTSYPVSRETHGLLRCTPTSQHLDH